MYHITTLESHLYNNAIQNIQTREPSFWALDRSQYFPAKQSRGGQGGGDSLNWPNRGRPAEFLGPRNTSSLDDCFF